MDPGFRLDGRYRLERRTGRHGPAQVWRARDELLARPVAVTLAGVPRERRDLRRRLRDAARAAAALDHPNIVTTYDYGEAEGPGGDALTYAVTEFLAGESLAARLTRGLPEPHEAVAVCAQVADALAAVHACGIVHGGLSPAQVLLTEDGAKLLGLGLSAVAARDDNAPEPLEAEAAQAEDVRALGRILTACLPAPTPGGPQSASMDVREAGEIARWCGRAGDGGRRPAAAEVAEMLAAQSARMPAPAGGAGGAAAEGARRRLGPWWLGPWWRGARWRGARRAVLLGGAGAAVLAVLLAPLAVISASLPDGPRGIVPPPLPSRSAQATPAPDTAPGAAPGAGGRQAAPADPPGGSVPPAAAVPAADAREAAVRALSRMRRAIDVGMAEGEVGPRFGTELATEVTTLMNEVDGGRPVDLGRRVGRLREALAGRGPGDVSPERAAGLSALLAEVPVHS